MRGREKIQGGNKLRDKTVNAENYHFHMNKLARLFVITLLLFTLNFASTVNRVLGSYQH
jgi:hypothetical protein